MHTLEEPAAGSSPRTWVQELGASFDETSDIPAGIKDQVEEWREKLIESAVELDDDVMERYLEVGWPRAGRPHPACAEAPYGSALDCARLSLPCAESLCPEVVAWGGRASVSTGWQLRWPAAACSC